MAGQHEGGRKAGSIRSLAENILILFSILACLGFMMSQVFAHDMAMKWLWGATSLVAGSRMLAARRRAVFYTWGSVCVAGALAIADTAVHSSHVLTVLSVCAAAIACIALAWPMWGSARRLFSRSAKSEV